MNLIRTTFLAAGLSALLAVPVVAQQDNDHLKKKILREVEEKLRKEEEAILREIERAIDSELSRILEKREEEPAPKKEEPAEKKPAPARERGYLGVALIELTDDDRKDLGVDQGIKVAQVVPNSPAEDAGLRVDDVITAIDGTAVKGFEQVRETVGQAGAGETVKVTFVRGGKKRTVAVTLGGRPGLEPPTAKAPAEKKKEEEGPDDLRERVKKFLEKKEAEPAPRERKPPAPRDDDPFALSPERYDQFRGILENLGVDPSMLDSLLEEGDDGNYHFAPTLREFLESFDFSSLFEGADPLVPDEPAPPPARPMRPYIGIQPEEPSPELRAQLDIPEGEGLLIYEVVPGSPAEKAGLRKHDILVRLDGKAVRGEDSLAAFMDGAKVGQKVPVTVIRKGRETKLTITVGGRAEE